MSSDTAGTNGGGGEGAVLDTSWINEPAAGGSGGAPARGRGGSKRRTRRRTLSPSIGKHNYMSNVDFNDPMNFPSLPSSGGSNPPGNGSGSGSGGADVPAEGGVEGPARLGTVPRAPPSSPPRERIVTADPPSAAAGYFASRSHSSSAAGQDADLPDPTVVAGLFDIEGMPTPPPPGPLPLGTLGTLGNLEIVQASSSVTRKKKGAEPQQSSGKQPRGPSARGRSNRRATFGGADARILVEAENLGPDVPSKPSAPAPAAAAAAAATRASPSNTTAEVLVVAGQQQGPDLASAAATAPHGGDGEGEERNPSQPRAAKQKSRSRNSRRRSIVMPSEAQPLMDSDLDDGGAERGHAAATAAATSPTSNSKEGEGAAGRKTPATDSGEGKSSQGGRRKTGSSKKTTPSEEFPLSSVNATSCLSRSLAAQRGWALGDQETRKQLFRAYYAAAPGSQRARRVAARLFCLTGYALSPVAPEDARVLCAAAGDGMGWGLDETEPRLVSQPIRRETKEQKRVLVLRIKPLFDIMEKASSEEKLKAEAATGVVSRKASPDGYRYEDRETGKPVDPEEYKMPYLEHVRAVRASRIQEFAARRNTAPPAAASALEEAVGASNAEADAIASSDIGTVHPAAAASVAKGEVGEARLDEVVLPAAPATDPKRAARAANAEGSSEGDRLPDDVSLPDGVAVAKIGSDDMPLKVTGRAAAAAEKDMVVTGGNDVDTCMVERVDSPAALPEAEPRAPAAPATAEGESPGAAMTSAIAAEALLAAEQGSAAPAGAAAEKDAAEGGATLSASRTPIVVAPISLVLGGGVEEGAEVGDTEVSEETSGDAPVAVVTGDKVETPCSSSAAGDVCTLGDASVSSEPVCTRPEEPEEPDEDCLVRDAAIVSPESCVDQETPHGGCGPDSSGEAASGRGDGTSSPHLSEAPSPVLANAGGIVSPITTPSACAESFRDGACGADNPPTFGDRDHGVGPEQTGVGNQAVAPGSLSPSPRSNDPSRKVSTEDDKHDEGSAAAASSSFGTSPAALASPASSPLVAAGGFEQQDGPLSGRTATPHERVGREPPSGQRATPPYPSSHAGSPATSEVAASPGEGEEGAEEIAALKERLWAAWDAAVQEYENGVALVRSRRDRRTPTPAGSSTTVGEASAVVACSPAGTDGPTPTAGKVGETSRQEEGASVSGSEAARTPAPPADGMPTPDSPLLPLLQLRLEKEEGDLFEYSSTWCGSGAGAGSSQTRGGKTRRRSLAKEFSLQKTHKESKIVQEAASTAAGKPQGAAEEAAAQETEESEMGGGGGSDRTAALCKLCCRKACDTVLHPCEHSACGVCVEKLRLQAEQSGQALSCPWDRKLVDEICLRRQAN